MTNYNFVLALDPSGNYNEGRGTTGWCLFDCVAMQVAQWGFIDARKYKSMESYWDAHIELIEKCAHKHPEHFGIVIEDYLLYGSRAADQIHSRMETPKLIGVLQYWCFKHNIAYHMQAASLVKTRWTNEVLNYKSYIRKYKAGYKIPHLAGALNRHCLDSIRHAVHYATFMNKAVLNK